ncbi:MAG: NosD domain-containing protein [Candidatus Thorarchaeota archaeon]
MSKRPLILSLVLFLAFLVALAPISFFQGTASSTAMKVRISSEYTNHSSLQNDPPAQESRTESPLPSTLPQYLTMDYTPHSTMVISSDADFPLLGWNGTGTPDDPYSISNFHIINNQTIGILIQHTRAHFVVNNCLITGAQVGIKHHGIYFLNVSNGVIADSIFQYTWTAILLNQSHSNHILRNWCTDARNSLQLLSANDNHVRNNSLVYNSLGLDLDEGSNNQFWWNVFSGNRLNAFDNGGPNIFEYNYWSTYLYGDANDDGIGDIEFQLSGTAQTFDNHPLMWLPEGHPVVWHDSLETSYIVEAGWYFTLLFEAASAPPGNLQWLVNDSFHFEVTDGLLESRMGLYGDRYVLNITAIDTLGYSVQTLLFLTVWDTRAPEWIDPPEYLMLWAYDEPVSIYFNATDPSGIDTYYLEDTETFSINESGYLTNRTSLVLNSVYDIWVNVNDTWGHTTSLGVTLIAIIPLPPRLPEIYYQIAWVVIILTILLLVGFTWHFLKWKHYRTDIYY